MGMNEAFELAEEVGDKALSVDELLFMADARKRKGCKLIKNRLSHNERIKVINLGAKCKAWKERNW